MLLNIFVEKCLINQLQASSHRQHRLTILSRGEFRPFGAALWAHRAPNQATRSKKQVEMSSNNQNSCREKRRPWWTKEEVSRVWHLSRLPKCLNLSPIVCKRWALTKKTRTNSRRWLLHSCALLTLKIGHRAQAEVAHCSPRMPRTPVCFQLPRLMAMGRLA